MHTVAGAVRNRHGTESESPGVVQQRNAMARAVRYRDRTERNCAGIARDGEARAAAVRDRNRAHGNIAATGTGQGLAINDVTVGTLDVASVTTGT
ncbi:hypothetical protein, partial [Sphingomonas koreensis]|uniref:hypothetical protein n=1 Tax=Sphingomonas koreensis TaxID=93064 RepID=UPI0019D03A6F